LFGNIAKLKWFRR